MKTIAKEVMIEFEERKSKFIGYAKPINSKKEAEEFIMMIQKRHSDATHNVPAYRVIDENREYFKFSDDGEPQNTAGKPVAEILNILDIYNIVIVVTRYFGGIKLGAGGLVRNYAKASKLAVEAAQIVEFKKKKEILLDFNYAKIDEVERVLNENSCEVIYKNYEERVTYKAIVTDEGEKSLREINGILVISDT